MKGMDRRSREIPACLILLATSAALAGCDPRRDCIDASGQKLPDSAGLTSASIRMHEIGWNSKRACFVDTGEAPIKTLFKLYPWETLLGETFGPQALRSIGPGQRAKPGRTQWIEPIWKMLWSNKALLAVLWELYPDHDLLLPAYLGWTVMCVSLFLAGKVRTSAL